MTLCSICLPCHSLLVIICRDFVERRTCGGVPVASCHFCFGLTWATSGEHQAWEGNLWRSLNILQPSRFQVPHTELQTGPESFLQEWWGCPCTQKYPYFTSPTSFLNPWIHPSLQPLINTFSCCAVSSLPISVSLSLSLSLSHTATQVTRTLTLSLTHTYTHSNTLIHAHTQSHAHSHTVILRHTLLRAHTVMYTYLHSHTHTYILTYKLIHKHTHSNTFSKKYLLPETKLSWLPNMHGS